MKLETPKAHADENCRYICGPSKTLNNFTIQLHATQHYMGQNIIVKTTNDKNYDVHYKVSIEKQYATGWGYYDADFNWGSMLPAGTNEEIIVSTGNGESIIETGTFRMKVEVENAAGSIDTMYTALVKITR